MRSSPWSWILPLFALAGPAFAQKFHDPASPRCGDCHSLTSAAPDPTASCLECHDAAGSKATFAWAGSTAPKVKGSTTFELPGGNFTEAVRFPGRGHSPMGPEFSEPVLTTAPGGSFTRASLTCASCHDPHGDSARSFPFRNLKRFDSGEWIESTDEDEAILTRPIDASNHNVYRGRDFGKWCGACHTKLHGGSKWDVSTGEGGGWLRHPTATRLPGSHARNYGPTSDFALPIVTTFAGASPSSEWPLAAAESSVFCLSCHKAHASSFADAMRWDASVAQRADRGCGKCHGL